MAATEVAAVAAFVRILSATQTQALHEWDEESLRRALAWARSMERLAQNARKAGDEATTRLDEELATRMAGAALPTTPSSPISSVQLLSSTRAVCESILVSPWLISHPNRPMLTSRVLHRLHRLESQPLQSQTDAAERSCSELLTKKIRTQRYSSAVSRVAERVGAACNPSRVRVGFIELEVISGSSFALQRRSLKLKSLARTLQGNACAAASLSDPTSEGDFLDRIQQQLRSCARDVVESIVWSVVLEWPPDQPVASHLRAKITDAVDNFMETHSPQSHFLLHPWLAAMFARHSARFAAAYIPSTLTAGLILDRGELRARVGALILLSPVLGVAVEKQLERSGGIVPELLAA